MIDRGMLLQRMIADLVTIGWGEVVLGLTAEGTPEDPQLVASIQRLAEELQLEARSEEWADMLGYFFGPLEQLEHWRGEW